MDSIWSIMDILFAGAGLYALYAFVLLKTKGEFTTSILMNKEVDIRKCKDIEGYKHFIMPKIMIFGLSALIYGCIGLINTYVMPLSQTFYLICMGVFFVILIWYAYQTKKGVQLFW